MIPRTTIEKWQMPDPVCVGPDSPASRALELMAERGIRHLPVVDSEHRVVGVLSQNDLRAAIPFLRDLEQVSPAERARLEPMVVGDLMSYAPETIRLDEPLERAARRLAERHLGCLPVVDPAGKLLGIFTETDALRALVASISAHGEVPGGELEALVEELRRERWRLRRQLERRAQAGRARTESQREIPADAAERGALRGEEVIDEPLAGLAARRLAALDHALARAARGQLGICEACGGRIPPARLRVLPGATRCIACARGEEPAREAPLEAERIPPLLPGNRVHTPQGEGTLLRFASFGTCGECGETEGRWDEELSSFVCSSEGCALPLADVEEIAVVEIGDGSVSIAPESLRPVDPEPYE